MPTIGSVHHRKKPPAKKEGRQENPEPCIACRPPFLLQARTAERQQQDSLGSTSCALPTACLNASSFIPSELLLRIWIPLR